MDLRSAKTAENLMRALAGETLARMRYELAAEAAEREKLPVLSAVFRYTAGQEREHAEVFAGLLRKAGLDSQTITAAYPLDPDANTLALLAAAAKNEEKEHAEVYPAFAAEARAEGFEEIARKLELIAQVERCHAGRFEAFRKLLAENRLFVSDTACGWVCLNCGHELNAKAAPAQCPVCGREGFFLRLSMSPYKYQ
jgi:rubrerythrin